MENPMMISLSLPMPELRSSGKKKASGKGAMAPVLAGSPLPTSTRFPTRRRPIPKVWISRFYCKPRLLESNNYNTIDLAGMLIEKYQDNDRKYVIRIAKSNAHWNNHQWIIAANCEPSLFLVLIVTLQLPRIAMTGWTIWPTWLAVPTTSWAISELKRRPPG